MKKEQYKNMVTQHLQSNVYEREHDRNADTKVMTKIENLTDKYSDVLEEHEIEYLTEFRPSTSNFYVPPKVHKSKIITNLVEEKSVEYLKIENPPEIPSRLIVAGLNSPTHRLSIILHIILRPLTEKVTSYVRDDMDFLNYLPNKIDFDSTFVSFDVTSLYTNISHELGIEAISYWIDQFPDFLFDDRFTKDFFITEALRLVLENNYFKFDGELWHQLVGTAMGTNVAVIYAILVMAYLERKLYTRVNEMYPADYAEYIIKNWRRFIDDCFLIRNNQYNLGEFFDMLNNLDDNIKFTMEKHTDKLPFLDIMVMKNEDGTISTDIFYKITKTHRYLDFRSCHKHHVKINVPFNLSRKLCLVVSDKDRLDHRLKELKGFLLACHYPAKVIDEAISSAKDRTQHQRPPRNEDVLPLVITHNPHHSLDFGYIKSLMNNVESTRLQRAFRNKAILAN